MGTTQHRNCPRAAPFRQEENRQGDCENNAVMESSFSTAKTELRERFDSGDEAKQELFEYIEVFYNQRRRHSSINSVSPAIDT